MSTTTRTVAAAGPTRLGLWMAALAIDVVTPFGVAPHTYGVPPHPEHLPERLGLFTIILFGESVAAAIHSLDHADPLRRESWIVAASSSPMAFFFWTGYFERARGVGRAPRRARRRRPPPAAVGYGHIPLYVGVAGLAAGTVALAAHPDAHGAGPWPFPVAAALAMAGVTLVAASHGDRALSAGWPHLALALLTAALPLGTDGYLVVPASAVAAAVQVMLSARRDR